MRTTVLLIMVIGSVLASPAGAQQPYGYAPPPGDPTVESMPISPPPPAVTMTPQFQPQLLAPPQQQPHSTPWNLLNDARALIQQGRPQQALDLTKEFIRIKPLEPEGYFWEGVALDNLMQTQSAIGAYDIGIAQVLKAGMDSAELRMNIANDLLKIGRVDEAIAQYRRAVQIDPGLPLVHLNLGRALVEKGDIEGALEAFQRCDDLHFKPYQLSYYRAKALVKAGRIADAKAQVLGALSKLNNESPASRQLRQEFSALLSEQRPPQGTTGGTTDF